MMIDVLAPRPVGSGQFASVVRFTGYAIMIEMEECCNVVQIFSKRRLSF